MTICKKGSVFLLFFALILTFAQSDDWILSAEAFSLAQRGSSESAKKSAELLPQLILEQLSLERERVIPKSELLDRALFSLQTERLSLFLQLSKEVKVRDSLVIEKKKPRELEKAIVSADKKIAEIQIQIEENLKKEEEEKKKYALEGEKKEQGAKRGTLERLGAFLPFPFFHKDEETQKIVQENVRLYKDDAASLFSPSKEAVAEGRTSRFFQKEVSSAKINGIISGSLSFYGDYVGVSAELTVYPGAKSFGVVSDVGNVGDLVSLARRVVRNLVPKIANSLPVSIEFDIRSSSDEKIQNPRVMIDGIVSPDASERVLLDAGIHTVSVEAAGFESVSTTYSFTGENRFLVKARLFPSVSGKVKIRQKSFLPGIFSANGIDSSPNNVDDGWAHLSVNGKPILAIFEDSKSGERAFVRLAAQNAIDGEQWKVGAKPFDRAANIDKRRRALYLSYSVLICSLPFTFYSLGEFTAANKAYSQNRASYEYAKKWQDRANLTQTITLVFAGWFAFELVRYLWAANRVLPAEASLDSTPPKAKTPLDEAFLLPMNEIVDGKSSLEQTD